MRGLWCCCLKLDSLKHSFFIFCHTPEVVLKWSVFLCVLWWSYDGESSSCDIQKSGNHVWLWTIVYSVVFFASWLLSAQATSTSGNISCSVVTRIYHTSCVQTLRLKRWVLGIHLGWLFPMYAYSRKGSVSVAVLQSVRWTDLIDNPTRYLNLGLTATAYGSEVSKSNQTSVVQDVDKVCVTMQISLEETVLERRGLRMALW